MTNASKKIRDRLDDLNAQYCEEMSSVMSDLEAYQTRAANVHHCIDTEVQKAFESLERARVAAHEEAEAHVVEQREHMQSYLRRLENKIHTISELLALAVDDSNNISDLEIESQILLQRTGDEEARAKLHSLFCADIPLILSDEMKFVVDLNNRKLVTCAITKGAEVDGLYWRITKGDKAAYQQLSDVAEKENNHLAQAFLAIACVAQSHFKDMEKAQSLAAQALMWLQQKSVTDKYAADCLGVFYALGLGVKTNDELATKYFKLSADQGYAAAQCNIAESYKGGKGVDKNLDEAIRYYMLAADQGDAFAQNGLGLCYDNGIGVQLDKAEAIKYFTLSAHQGYSAAQCILGCFYEKGSGVEQNIAEAFRYYKLSAEQADSAGLFCLAGCYDVGKGVELNRIEAMKCYTLSADQGHNSSQFFLGYYYEHGQVVDQNMEKAIKYYTLSADQGHLNAQYNLAVCYEVGNGVAQDSAEAIRYYRLAANQGHGSIAKITALTTQDLLMLLFICVVALTGTMPYFISVCPQHMNICSVVASYF